MFLFFKVYSSRFILLAASYTFCTQNEIDICIIKYWRKKEKKDERYKFDYKEQPIISTYRMCMRSHLISYTGKISHSCFKSVSQFKNRDFRVITVNE